MQAPSMRLAVAEDHMLELPLCRLEVGALLTHLLAPHVRRRPLRFGDAARAVRPRARPPHSSDLRARSATLGTTYVSWTWRPR